MKKQLVKRLALAATLAIAPMVAHAETVLKMASVAPSTSPWGKWAAAVSEKVAEVSGGDLKVELLLDAQAGDEQTILRQAMKGRVDIAFVSNVPMTLMDEGLALPSAPYQFASVEEGSCVFHQHLTKELAGIMGDAGVVPLTWMEVGQNIIFSKDPVRVPSDLHGKKVRVAPSISDVAFTDAIGASGVPLGTSDAIPALQTGAVDAATFPTVFGIAVGTHKIAPNVLVTNHQRLIGTIAVSSRVWETLSPEHQQILTAVYGPAGAQLTDVILGAEKALLGQLEGAGIPVHYPTDEELAAWKEATAGAADQLAASASGHGAEIAAVIANAKAACGS